MFKICAEPGLWYEEYHTAWHAEHPGAWQRRELEPGSFYAGDVWTSSTLDWDRRWFNTHEMQPPRHMRHITADPSHVPLAAKLEPGESMHAHIEEQPQ